MTVNTLAKTAEPGSESRRIRDCLRCGTQFESAWAGERVCPRCKGSTAWRNGSGMEVRRTRSRSTPAGRS